MTDQYGYEDLRGRLMAVLIRLETRLTTATRDFVAEELDHNELGLALEVMVEELAERRTPVDRLVIDDPQNLARQMEMDLDVAGVLVPAREIDSATVAAMERYLGEVQAVLIESGRSLSAEQLAEPWNLVEHGEPAEGLVTLAWVISEQQVRVGPDVVEGIRRLSAGFVEPSELPSDLEEWVDPGCSG